MAGEKESRFDAWAVALILLVVVLVPFEIMDRGRAAAFLRANTVRMAVVWHVRLSGAPWAMGVVTSDSSKAEGGGDRG